MDVNRGTYQSGNSRHAVRELNTAVENYRRFSDDARKIGILVGHYPQLYHISFSAHDLSDVVMEKCVFVSFQKGMKKPYEMAARNIVGRIAEIGISGEIDVGVYSHDDYFAIVCSWDGRERESVAA